MVLIYYIYTFSFSCAFWHTLFPPGLFSSVWDGVGDDTRGIGKFLFYCLELKALTVATMTLLSNQ